MEKKEPKYTHEFKEQMAAQYKSGTPARELVRRYGMSKSTLHKAAKNAFDELGVKKLPTVKSLQAEYAKLLAEKKAAYAEYRRSRDEMRELLLHKQNVDRTRQDLPRR